jgi:hypothetical protein
MRTTGKFFHSEKDGFSCCEGFSVELNKAVALLTEIITKCPELNGRNFLIMKIELPYPVETSGYELVIRTKGNPLDKKTLKTLKDIAARENLNLEEKETSVMIFDPYEWA